MDSYGRTTPDDTEHTTPDDTKRITSDDTKRTTQYECTKIFSRTELRIGV